MQKASAAFLGFKETSMEAASMATNDPSEVREPYTSASYITSGRRAILDSLERTIERGRSMQIIIGEEGAGKSYILRKLYERLSDRCMVIYLPYPRISLAQILREGLHQLGVRTRGDSEAEGAAIFRAVLSRIGQSGKTTLLIIDDAQFMGSDVVNDLMDLWEEFSHGIKGEVFSILLAGTDALCSKIRPEARSEVFVDPFVRLLPLAKLDTEAYIRSRFGESALFSDSAVEAVHRLSGGRPKMISRICSEAIGRASQTTGSVSARMIREIGRDRFLIVSPDKAVTPSLEIQEPKVRAKEATDRRRFPGMASVKRGLSYLRSITAALL